MQEQQHNFFSPISPQVKTAGFNVLGHISQYNDDNKTSYFHNTDYTSSPFEWFSQDGNLESVNSFFTLFRMAGEGSEKMLLTNFPQLFLTSSFNPNEAGFFEVIFFQDGREGQFEVPSYFQKNLSNINITYHNC